MFSYFFFQKMFRKFLRKIFRKKNRILFRDICLSLKFFGPVILLMLQIPFQDPKKDRRFYRRCGRSLHKGIDTATCGWCCRQVNLSKDDCNHRYNETHCPRYNAGQDWKRQNPPMSAEYFTPATEEHGRRLPVSRTFFQTFFQLAE